MSSFRHLPFVCLLIAVASACAPEISDRETRYKVALAYGLKAFDGIEQIRYTFNVKLGGREITRAWVWYPKVDRVVYNDEVDYTRGDLAGRADPDLEAVDRKFINDRYWLLFPLHLVWDRGIAVTEDVDPQPLPIGDGRAHRLTVAYPDTGGYTPGDAYEVYVGEDNRILEWVYHRGGLGNEGRPATWEDHRHAGPLTLSMRHRGPDGDFRLWFTDVAVRLVDVDEWFEPR